MARTDPGATTGDHDEGWLTGPPESVPPPDTGNETTSPSDVNPGGGFDDPGPQ
jgi:hypothetical protein